MLVFYEKYKCTISQVALERVCAGAVVRKVQYSVQAKLIFCTPRVQVSTSLSRRPTILKTKAWANSAQGVWEPQEKKRRSGASGAHAKGLIQHSRSKLVCLQLEPAQSAQDKRMQKKKVLAELRFDRRSVMLLVTDGSYWMCCRTYPPGYEPGALPLRHSAF